MLNKGTDLLDEILEKQMVGTPKGLGFDDESINKQKYSVCH